MLFHFSLLLLPLSLLLLPLSLPPHHSPSSSLLIPGSCTSHPPPPSSPLPLLLLPLSLPPHHSPSSPHHSPSSSVIELFWVLFCGFEDGGDGIIFDMLSIMDPPPSEWSSFFLPLSLSSRFFSFPLMAVRRRPRAAERSDKRSPLVGAASSFIAFLARFLSFAFFRPALEVPPEEGREREREQEREYVEIHWYLHTV